MGERIALDRELKALFQNRSPAIHFYFQPPSNISMTYPCVLYRRDTDSIRRADDALYTYTKKYIVTCITDDPDSDMLETIVRHFPMCRPSVEPYVSDNLYHFTAALYY